MHHRHKVDAPSGTGLLLGAAAAAGRNSTPEMLNRFDRIGHGNDNPREATWSAQVAWAARHAMRGRIPMTGAIAVRIYFLMPRPAKATHRHPSVGDIDKLIRSCLDAMSSIVYQDDRHVVQVYTAKFYASEGKAPGCFIVAMPVARTVDTGLPPDWGSW